MAERIYMAGVATVDLFDGKNLFATAKTLTESSIAISTSAEDIRGGEGAALLGKYYHTSAFDLTLTDALFSMEYLAASVGADLDKDNANIMIEEGATADADGALTLSKVPVAFADCEKIYVYVREAAEDSEWNTVEVTTANAAIRKVTGLGIVSGGKYCVKYFATMSGVAQIRVNSNYIPATLRALLRVNLYAAGQSEKSKTKVGHLEIDIPRFQLDGSQDLSMSMTGASTTSIKGSALATEGCVSGNCTADNYYAEIKQVLDDTNWYDDAKFLAVEGGDITVAAGSTFDPGDFIYVIFKDSAPKRLSSIADAQYTITPTSDPSGSLVVEGTTVTVGGTFTSGNLTVAVTGTNLKVEGLDVNKA